LANDLKISVNQLRLIEWHNKYPKYQIRSRLCKYFDVSQDQMFYYSED
jgi:DNA-binding XRE family transcriptional regulator